jgi:aminoglycoside phosphotransferase (APT) family kinase protein
VRVPRRHADEVETDVALVRALLQEQFPEWAGRQLRPVAESGTVNALYRLGDELVVRIPRNRPSLWSDLVDDELTWLPRLAPLLPVKVPVPVARGRPADRCPHEWGIFEWLPGENPTPGDVPESLAGELAELVRTLHSVDLPGGPDSVRGRDLARFDEFTRANLTALEGELDTGRAEALWDEALALPPWPHEPVWIHADVMPGNLLLEDGHLTAVIDWGGSGMGDPAVDLMVAWNTLSASGRKVFREALDVNDDTWARGRGWALWTGLGGIPYYRETFPEFAANARRTVQEVLEEAR